MATFDLGPQAAEVARVVVAVRDEQLTDPTPCVGTSVAGLLDHFVGLTLAFRMAARKEAVTGAPRASAEALPGDWRTRLPAQLDELASAWRGPSAWEGTAEVAGAVLPGSAMGMVALNEVVVHGWDLAVATGQPYRVDLETAQACLDFGREFLAGAPQARGGIYGPEVPVADDAPVFDRLLGFTGRDPGWCPS
ncbi:MAG: TIGR03086 family metal-binding protein [Kineosporiaceae bacterium]